ncbi:MAG TPA: hypothetical protein VFQ36_08230 [Ktedonobacteraceae bacterium]|nr:hypothetical protein [Ktedonobacteraceae bacterium]
MKKQKISAGIAALLMTLACFLLSAGGLAYYVTNYRPNAFHAQATAVARSFITAQAQATYQSNLQASARATVTANFNHTLYMQTISSQPVLNDSLSLANDPYWEQSSPPGTQCTFAKGAYHAQSSTVGHFSPCLLQTSPFSDFALQVNMTLIKGEAGGIIFHFAPTTSSADAYLFTISTGGFYSLILIHDEQLKLLTQGYNSAIYGNPNVPNQIMVITHGQTILLFVNDQLVDSASDNTLTSGAIGMFAYDTFKPTDVAFNNVQVWKL